MNRLHDVFLVLASAALIAATANGGDIFQAIRAFPSEPVIGLLKIQFEIRANPAYALGLRGAERN